MHPRLQHDHALLSSVHLELQTSKGALTSSWESDWPSQRLWLNVTIPHNARGRVVLECPQKGGRWAQLDVSQQPLLRRTSVVEQGRQLLRMGDIAASGGPVDGVSAWRELADGAIEMEVASGVYELHGSWM